MKVRKPLRFRICGSNWRRWTRHIGSDCRPASFDSSEASSVLNPARETKLAINRKRAFMRILVASVFVATLFGATAAYAQVGAGVEVGGAGVGAGVNVGGVGVGVGLNVAGPNYYDGYYDGYYGPFNDGYWGDDGAFYYQNGSAWQRDDGHHFQRGAGNGFNHVHGSGAHREH